MNALRDFIRPLTEARCFYSQMDERRRAVREAVNRIVSETKIFSGGVGGRPGFQKLWPRGGGPRLPSSAERPPSDGKEQPSQRD